MSKNLAQKDEIERFKNYIEIAKYAISIVIALATVCGVIIKLDEPIQIWEKVVFGCLIFLNVAVFLISHRLVSEALRGITHELDQAERNSLLKEINSGPYSLFVISFGLSLFLWSSAILVIAIF